MGHLLKSATGAHAWPEGEGFSGPHSPETSHIPKINKLKIPKCHIEKVIPETEIKHAGFIFKQGM